MVIFKAFYKVIYCIETLYLFTRSDFKTIFFPTIISACAVSPPTKVSQVLATAVWVWLHLLQTDVSNQTYSVAEDAANKPWRPLPSGRITQENTRRFRWAILVVCLCLSAWHGAGVVIPSASLAMLLILHDNVGFNTDPVLKNLMNAGGYLSFESGAFMIMSSRPHFDQTSLIALLASGLLVFTTVHVQDFQDVEGDERYGRRTIPMIAPEGSRVYALAALPLWSLALSALWGLGPLSAIIFLSVGTFIGSRFFRFRDVKQDERSFVLYNVWLLAAHTLPLNARRQGLNW